MPPRPPLNRLARGLHALGSLAVVALVVFVALAVYSASEIRPTTDASVAPGVSMTSNDSALIASNVSIANPGFFDIDGVEIHAEVRGPAPNGSLVGAGSSPEVRIPAGARSVIPVAFRIPLDDPADAFLLTHDVVLPASIWVNATYARDGDNTKKSTGT